MKQQIIYLSGSPGSGKTTILKELGKLGFIIFYELIESFPKEKYPEPRSFSTAKYIFEQYKKRDKKIRESKGIIFVDKHPMDSVIIANGLLQNPRDIEKIEDYYKNYKFADGKIIYFKAPHKIREARFLSKNIALIKRDMLEDILGKYEGYHKYINPDLEIDSRQNPKKIVKQILRFIKSYKV